MINDQTKQSISKCIVKIAKGGDDDAAADIWQRYVGRLIRLATKRLVSIRHRSINAEDVVQEAFFSLFRGAREGRFRKLDNSDDLWQILVMLTCRKAADHCERDRSQKRGGGQLRGETELIGLAPNSSGLGIAEVVESTATPADLDELAFHCEHLLAPLSNSLREVALCKLEGYANSEISKRTGHSLRSVERKLKQIRDIWTNSELIA